MRALDYKSVSTVAVHINNLIAKGHLLKRDRSARSLEVVDHVALPRSTERVTKAEGKWLIDRIEARFQDYNTTPSDKKRDDLFVLVGALHVLGLDDAVEAYKPRLPKS